MAWRALEQVLETGVVVDPRDVTVNVDGFAQEMNAHLDRDNVQASAVTAAKLVTKALVSVGSNPQGEYLPAGAYIQLIEGSSGAWVEVTSMRTSVSVGDGELTVDADVNGQWQPILFFNEKWRARMLINGNPVAHTDWVHVQRTTTTVSLTGSAVVRTGTAVVQVFVQIFVDPWWKLTDINNGRNSAKTYEMNPIFSISDLEVWAGNVVWANRMR